MPGTESADRVRGRARRALAGAVTVLLVLLLLAGAVFALTGGRAHVVRTPSMGTAAPVGTLLLTRPATVAQVRVGDVVVARPPGGAARTVSHRVVEVRGGALRTRGDVNGSADPWPVTDAELRGRVVAALPGAGYACRVLPPVVLAALLVGALARALRPDLRGPAVLAATAVVYLVVVLSVRPFVGVVELAVSAPQGRSQVLLASTGVLPVRVQPLPGQGTGAPLDLRYGQVGTATVTGLRPGERAHLSASPHLPPAGWAALVALWLLPLLWGFSTGPRGRPVPA